MSPFIATCRMIRGIMPDDQIIRAGAPASDSLPIRAAKPDRLNPLFWFAPVVLLVAAGLSFAVDARLNNYVFAQKDAISSWFNPLLAVVGVLIGMQGIRSLPNGNRLLAGFLVSILVPTIITHALKVLVGRTRPFLHDGEWAYRSMTAAGEYASFPSGHTQFAFAVGTWWFLHWPRLRWMALIWAPLVAFERILTQKHFLSDVLAGAGIGIACVLVTTRVLGPKYFQMFPATTRMPGQRDEKKAD
ncbi:MAG: phosphatase PAP2 family protein [Phycisphaerae bacterium]